MDNLTGYKYKTHRFYSPIKIAIIYLTFSLLWTFFSNAIIHNISNEPDTITALTNYKGSFFSIVSACLLFFFIRRAIRKQNYLTVSLLDNRQKFDAYSESTRDIIWEINTTGKFIFVNGTGCRMLGIEPEDISKYSVEQLSLESGGFKNLDEFIRAVEAGNVHAFESVFCGKDGINRIMQTNCVALRDINGQLESIMCTSNDITEKKKAEKENREYSEQLKLLYDASRKLNLTLDINGLCRTLFESLSGIMPADNLVISSYDKQSGLITINGYWLDNRQFDIRTIPPVPLAPEGCGIQSKVIRESRSLKIDNYETVKKSQFVYSIDESGEMTDARTEQGAPMKSALAIPLKLDGEVKGVLQLLSKKSNSYSDYHLKLLESLSLHIAYAQQNALLYSKVNIELAERIQAEKALRESEENYRNLIESALGLIWLIDRDGNVSFINKSCNEILGYDYHELLGKPIDFLVSDEQKEKDNLTIKEKSEDGKTKMQFETVMAHKNGKNVNLLVNLLLLSDENGKFKGSTARAFDITEWKKTEEENREYNEQIKILYQTSQQINRTLDINEICDTIFKSLRGIVPSDSMTISSFDENTNLITFRGYWIENKQIDVKNIPSIPYAPDGTGIQSTAIRTGKSLLVNDYDERTRNNKLVYFFNDSGEFIDGPLKENEVIHSGLIVPLKLEGKITGVLQVLSFDKYLYTESQLKLVESLSSYILAAQQNALLFEQVNRELSERKLAEETLRKSEEKYHVIFESTGTATIIVEEDTSISMANEECHVLTGYTTSELIGEKWTRFVAPESLYEMFKNHNLRRLSPSKAPSKYEVKLLNKAGEIRNAILDIGIVYETRQSIVSIVDITEQRKAIEALRFSEEKYRNIVETANEGIWILDKANKTTFANRKMAQMLGYEIGELIGKSIFEFIENIDNSNILTGLVKDVKKISSANEFRLVKKNGEHFWTLFSSDPLFDSDENFSGTMALVTDINEQKLAQIALVESESKYRTLIETTPFAVRMLDLDGKILYANPQTALMFGYDNVNELLGKNVVDLANISEKNIAFEALEEVIKKGSVKEKKINYQKKDGTMLPAELTATLLTDNDGSPIGIISIDQDITDRKMMEDRLKESEAYYRTLIETIPVGIVLINKSGEIQFLSPQIYKMFNIPEEFNPVGTRYVNWISPSERDLADRRLKDTLASKDFSGTIYDYRLFRFDNTEFWGHTNSSPYYDSEGSLKGVLVAIQDISNIKSAEKDLVENKEKLNSILSSAMDVIITVDESRKIVLFNKAAEKLFIYPAENAIGKDINIFIPERFHDSHNEEINTFVESNASKRSFDMSGKLLALRSDGKEIPIETSLSSTEVDGKKYFTVILRDITDRLKFESQLVESNEKLHSLAAHLQNIREEERLSISRDIHDELGQNLSALKMDIVLLAKEIDKISEFPNKESVGSELKAMADLTDKTIKWVRKLATELRPDVLDRFGLYETIAWHAEEFTERTGIKTEISLEGDDSVLNKEQSIILYRILQESLTNISRHSSASKVEIKMSDDGDNFVLKISDNGKGITEAEMKRGKSLGLIGMKERAYIIGANIKITGIAGKGTTLEITIPKLIEIINEY